MAKIKFDPSAIPLNKEHYGFTFQRNNYGFSMFPAGKNDRKRYPLQWEKMQFMSKAIRNWRNMSPETKNAWNVFATTYPQPTEKDPNVFLTGYQLFLKRNFYRFLHEGIDFDFMLLPELAELPTPDFSIEIIENGMCVDVTEEYIRNHGILPEVGQFVICRVIPIAVDSGQFFAPFIATLEVQEVYIDGLVCSFNFPNVVENIVFSLYMSRPVYESVQYAGTKFRFMGCFKPTKFIQLTDTPETYEGAAGKVVTVKPDETGLEFSEGSGCEICPPVPGEGDAGKVITVNPAGDGYELAEGGGGGISCEDLLDCGIIQQILTQVENLQLYVMETDENSIPITKFGLLYNWYAATDARKITSSDDWYIPTAAQFKLLRDYLGGGTVAGGKMKLNDINFWNLPNTGADNSAKFNGKGAGIRSSVGLFSSLLEQCDFWCDLQMNETTGYAYRLLSTDSAFILSSQSKKSASSLMFARSAPGKPNYHQGLYVGNDSKAYRTIVHNSVEYTADLIQETRFRDGSPIPEVADATAWAALTTPGMCVYNNDWSNV